MTELKKPNGEILVHHRCTTCWDSAGGYARGRRPVNKKNGRYYYVCHLNDSHHWNHDESKILVLHRYEELERLFEDSMPSRMKKLERQLAEMLEITEAMRSQLAAHDELIRPAKANGHKQPPRR